MSDRAKAYICGKANYLQVIDLKVDVHTHLPRLRTRSQQAEENEKREAESRKHSWIGRPQGPRPPLSDDLTTWEGHYETMMKAVDKAIVFGVARLGQNFNVNDEVAEYVKLHPDKIIGFMSVHPNDPNCIEEMKRADGLGLKGLKIGPIAQGFHAHSEKAGRVYRQADRMGIPVLFHQATSPPAFGAGVYDDLLELADPLQLERIAVMYPDMKIILAHMGHPWWKETVVMIRRHKNMFADVSAMFYKPWDYYNALRFAYEWGQTGKLLLGSDYPIATPQETIDGTLHINDMLEGTKLPRVPEEDLEGIVNRNALEVLGIQS